MLTPTIPASSKSFPIATKNICRLSNTTSSSTAKPNFSPTYNSTTPANIPHFWLTRFTLSKQLKKICVQLFIPPLSTLKGSPFAFSKLLTSLSQKACTCLNAPLKATKQYCKKQGTLKYHLI